MEAANKLATAVASPLRLNKVEVGTVPKTHIAVPKEYLLSVFVAWEGYKAAVQKIANMKVDED